MKVYSPVTGCLNAMNTCSDPVFSSKAMGDGFIVIPHSSRVVSPIDGKISMIFPTKHAIGIVDEKGNEVLLHIGIDTVGLEGAPFDLKVNMGEVVKSGTLLLEVDFSFISAKNLSTEVIVLFSKIKNIKSLTSRKVEEGELVLEIK